MKSKTIRILSLLLAAVTLITSMSVSVFALNWDGSSAGGGGAGTAATVNGYAIRTTGDNVLGYRFSVVDKSGALKGGKCIDVFRNTSYGKSEYTNAYKFTVKYNKKQFIANQNGSYGTSKNSTNCYLETDMGFASSLPVASGMKTWQNNATNLNKVLSKLGIGAIANLKNGDKIIVEPFYDVKLEKTYHAVTVTELAIYGKHLLGANSDGGSSSVADSWGFISNYTNKHYPNELYTPDGQGLWTGVSAATKRLTFYNMINQGWGAGIAYTETKSDFSPVLSVVKCEAWPGAKSTRNSNHYGISTGNAFSNWTYGHGYPYSGGTIWYAVNFPAESENCYVKQTVSVVGGGSTSRNVYSKDGTWYDVALSPTTVPNDKSYLTVKAKVDWIDSSGKVLKSGTEKSFYIPIKPIVTRDQVTAYAIDGTTQCYSGSSGTSGKMYFGQRVSFKYKYGGTNTWASSNHLRGQSYRWNGSAWDLIYKTGAGEDVYIDNAALSSTKSYTAASSVGTYRIPLNSNEDAESYKMRFRFRTYWASDITNTGQETNYYLPIVKADAELYDMYLVDDDGYIVDRQNLEVGQHLHVRYVYKNNTDCKIFVNGYDDNGNQIPGVYAISTGGTITVDGGGYTVPNKRIFSIWGGVFLDGAGMNNTSWESDGTNNTAAYICRSNHPVTIVPITPNAPYRETTSVISAFRIYNRSSDNYTPTENLQVRFKVTKSNGTQICTETKSVIVPANDNNLVYFKWTVPTGLNSASVTVSAVIVDAGTTYNSVSNNRSTTPYTYYTTPDTKYEEKAPAGFTVPAAPSKIQNYATWSEYAYENGAFVKKNYAVGLPGQTNVKLTPESGNSAEKDASGNWTMKSGYGVWLELDDLLLGVSGYLSPPSSSYTGAQYCCALYPEYSYTLAANKCTTLYLNDYMWCFNKLNFTKTNKAYHYTPLYFPDGNYTVKVLSSDMWTPSGMIQSTSITRPIVISGNAYDDHYIGRR